MCPPFLKPKKNATAIEEAVIKIWFFTLEKKKHSKTLLKMDQLFLLPARVLAMDSLSFREDVASVAPDFFSSHHLKNSPPHNSLDSTDSNRSSVRVLEDTEGLVFARASNGCLWLCKCSPLFAYITHSYTEG